MVIVIMIEEKKLQFKWLTSEQPHGRYRLQTVRSLAGVSLMLRLLWASLRWDDMAVKPSAAVGTTRTGTADLQTTARVKCALIPVYCFSYLQFYILS